MTATILGRVMLRERLCAIYAADLPRSFCNKLALVIRDACRRYIVLFMYTVLFDLSHEAQLLWWLKGQAGLVKVADASGSDVWPE